MHTLELGLVSIGDTRATGTVEGSITNMQARAVAILQKPCGSTQVTTETRHVGTITDAMGAAKKNSHGQVHPMGGKMQEL